MDDLKVRFADLEWQGVPHDHFIAFCDELGFGGLRKRPHRWLALPEA